MAAKKSAKKPKGRARKPVKVRNLPAKALSGDDVRAVKGGDGLSSKIQVDYVKPTTGATLDNAITFRYEVR